MPLYNELELERLRQEAKWGGRTPDDTHGPFDWVRLLRHRLDDLADVRWMRDYEAGRYRAALLALAALTVAAIEAVDREGA